MHLLRIVSLNPLFLLGIIGLIAYCGAIAQPFVHDDVVFIKNNPYISDLTDPFSLFQRPSAVFPQFQLTNPYYRPLLELFYRVEYQLFGLNPYGYHFLNILIHLCNGFLLYTIFLMICRHNGLAFSMASLFLVHPVQTEAVACISGISNLLYVLCVLLSFWFYLKSRAEDKLPLGILSLLTYLCALFVKEQAIILPILLLVYEILFSKRHNRLTQSSIVLGSGFGLLTLGYLGWRSLVLGSVVTRLFDYPQELWLRILAIPKTLLIYLRILIAPYDLHYYRSLDTLASVGFYPILLILLLIGMILWARRFDTQGRRLFLFGGGWFLITLLPTLNIIPLIHEYSFIATFEHFLYLPMVGIMLMILVAIDQGCKGSPHLKKNFGRVVLTIVVGLCVVLTLKQNTYWRGEVPLFERAVRFEKHLARLRILLGKAYYFEKHYVLAQTEFQQAQEIIQGYLAKLDPQKGEGARQFYSDLLKEVYFNLAHVFEDQNEMDLAIEHYQIALVLDPGDNVLQNNLGAAYTRINDFQQAMHHFKQAVYLEPTDLMAKTNLAVCYIQKNDVLSAQQLLQEVLRQDKQYLPAIQVLNQLQNTGSR